MIKLSNAKLVDGSLVNVEIDQGVIKSILKSSGKDKVEGLMVLEKF